MESNSENVRFQSLERHKDLLDTLNSISWFLMDASWMMEFFRVAYILVPLVIGSGAVLALYDRRGAYVAINSGILFWIFMNISWMIADQTGNPDWLFFSKVFFIVGCLCILLAIGLAKNLRQTFSEFRRFRKKNW